MRHGQEQRRDERNGTASARRIGDHISTIAVALAVAVLVAALVTIAGSHLLY